MEKADYYFVLDGHPYRQVNKEYDKFDLYSTVFVGASMHDANSALALLNVAIKVDRLRRKCGNDGKLRLMIHQNTDVAIVTAIDGYGAKVGEERILVWPAHKDVMIEVPMNEFPVKHYAGKPRVF